MENTLFYDKKTGWDRMSDAEQAAMMEYAEGYKAFLDEAKTERDAVRRLQADGRGKRLCGIYPRQGNPSGREILQNK